MDTEIKKQDTGVLAKSSMAQGPRDGFRDSRGSGMRRAGLKRGPREARPRPEFDEKVISIRRVTRVAAGGKRFNFSVAVVIGNRKGAVGVGTGKAGDTSLAIDKAVKNAKKNLLHVKVTKTMSIAHEVRAKYSSGRVVIMPAPGRGIVAGSSVRTVIELAGLKDITAKLLSPTKNPLNIARVAILALSQISDARPTRLLETKTSVETKS